MHPAIVAGSSEPASTDENYIIHDIHIKAVVQNGRALTKNLPTKKGFPNKRATKYTLNACKSKILS